MPAENVQQSMKLCTRRCARQLRCCSMERVLGFNWLPYRGETVILSAHFNTSQMRAFAVLLVFVLCPGDEVLMNSETIQVVTILDVKIFNPDAISSYDCELKRIKSKALEQERRATRNLNAFAFFICYLPLR